MIKSTDVFKFEKWWVKKITLIVAVLVLAGCQSQAIPSTATATSTSTEIPATATLMPTNTPEPTATATELVLPDNAVRIVGGGYVYVENSKVMQVGKDGVTKEIKDISSDVVFQNMEDAGNILTALNAEAIKGFSRSDFFLEGGPYNSSYAGMIDSSHWQTLVQTASCDSESIKVVGITRAFARIKNPVNYPGYPDLGVAFMQVNGYPGLVPVVIGAFNNEGMFSNTLNNMRNFKLGEYEDEGQEGGMSLQPIWTSSYKWHDLQKVIENNFLVFGSIISVPSDEAQALEYNYAKHDPITAEMETLRNELLHFQAQNMGAVGNEIRTAHKLPLPSTGELLDMVDDQKKKFFIVPLPGPPALIHTDL